MTLLFAAAIGLSAFLLFTVQPLIAKALLPYLGGSAAVWNSCVLFFQALLLLGYFYVHAVVRKMTPRPQVLVHLAIALVALLLLPLGVSTEARLPDPNAPVSWLLRRLAESIALPFFVLSATAPLLQSWFARTASARAHDPYFLYVASNFGSMLALILYPSVIEPRLDLPTQASVWSFGLALFVALAAACGVVVWRTPIESVGSAAGDMPPPDDHGVTTRQKAVWVYLAFVPSTLMLSVTTYLTTDLAPMPLLWVVPLALYLLTFIVAFSERFSRRLAWWMRAPVWPLVAIVAFSLFTSDAALWLPVHLLMLFFGALLCHGELARRRPATAHLTDFYLAIAVGGVLGGLFNALIAPAIFARLTEYPLALALLMLVPAFAKSTMPKVRWPSLAIGVVLAVLLVATRWMTSIAGWNIQLAKGPGWPIVLALTLVGVASLYRPWRRFVLFALVMGLYSAWPVDDANVVYEARNFYGPLQVRQTETTRLLMHGTTLHGAQATDQKFACVPLTYYAESTPVGQLFGSFTGEHVKTTVGVVGLGVAALGGYAQPGQTWTFYEINPLVASVAEDRRFFTYLSDCVKKYRIEVGDARLTLARSTATYDLLVIDAYSSDAIPVHLLTREALRLYRERLTRRGILAMHITNRYLDLAPVLGALGADAGMTVIGRFDTVEAPWVVDARASVSDWVVLASSPDDLGYIRYDPRWRRVEGGQAPVWRDGFANVFGALSVDWQDFLPRATAGKSE